MTTPATSASGSSRPPKISGGVKSGRLPRGPAPAPKPVVLPKVMPYPKLHHMGVAEAVLKDHLCYVIRHYGNEGISVLILRDARQDKITVLCGDWQGNNLDLDGDSNNRLIQAALVFVQEDLKLFMELMHSIKLPQAQFFLALDAEGNLILTDIAVVQISQQVVMTKLAGPGMVRDLFGKIYRTQEVLKVEPLDDRAIEYIAKGTGTYEGDIIIKPSKYTTFSPGANDAIIPLYAEVRR